MADEQADLGGIREELSSRQASDGQFQFDAAALKRARPLDAQAVEKILERWSKLSEESRRTLLIQIVPPLAERLQMECPPPTDWFAFVRDFLAAEYRRQHRKLG